jgi:hypothetical protein
MCLCTTVFALTARAQELSKMDRDHGLQYLESTRKGVLEATKGLSDAQWNFKPTPDRWSVAEVLEHIAATEDMFLTMIKERVLTAPPGPPRTDEEIKKTDEGILRMVPDRSQKRQAPEPLRPTNRFGSPEAARNHFLETRAKLEELLKSTPDLRAHAADSPTGGKFDAYEWILFAGGHSERHTKQMLEVKADPNFPKQ